VYTSTRSTVPPAPPDPQIAAIEPHLQWVVADAVGVHPHVYAQATALLDALYEARRNQIEAAANRTLTETVIASIDKIVA
jgi:hypothetical protein